MLRESDDINCSVVEQRRVEDACLPAPRRLCHGYTAFCSAYLQVLSAGHEIFIVMLIECSAATSGTLPRSKLD